MILKIYRVMRFLYIRKIPILPKIIEFMIRIIFSCTLPYTVEIGSGTRFPHGGLGVVIHKESKIGKECKILQNVTIGGRNGKPGSPIIGDNVLIGAGAVILGNIKIGNNVAIGANSVVLKDIPDNAVVVGVPGKVIRYLEKDECLM